MALKLAQTASVSTTTELTISPKLRKKLIAALTNTAAIQAQIKELKAALAVEVAEVEEIRSTVGEKKFAYEGFKIARVEGQTAFGTKKNLIDAGLISLSQWDDATEFKPKKAYTKVTAPGEKDDDEG